MLADGYYLSTYFSISDINNVISTCVRHDQNMALWKKKNNEVELIHYWELERYTGEKHQLRSFYSTEQAIDVINQLLSEYNITFDDVEKVWGTLGIEKNVGDTKIENLDKRFTLHSYEHLYSCLLYEKKIFDQDTIVALAVDGGPDGECDMGMYNRYLYIASVSTRGNILGYEPVASPALIWLSTKNIVGLEEGTLMALGSACSAEYYGFENKFEYIYSYEDYVKEKKKLSLLIEHIMSVDLNSDYVKYYDNKFSEYENRVSMLVKIVTRYSLETLENNIDIIKNKYSLDLGQCYLALSGGFALNCPINSMLVKRFKKKLLAPPCVNDTGISLGLGLLKFYIADKDFTFSLKNAYWGKECSDEEVRNVIESSEFEKFIFDVKRGTPTNVVDDILTGPVVWVNGKAEIGPRALGARSILGDPRFNKTKDVLNEIKQRQWWRPVAPIVIEEKVNEWFEESYETKFMLNTFIAKKDKSKYIPAICHLDSSARVQTLSREDNNLLYDVLVKFNEITNIPMICNTSLNDCGEPIVNNTSEALNFALKKNINIVYINGWRIYLHNHEKYEKKDCYLRNISIFANDEQLLIVEEKIKNCLKILTQGELHHVLCNQFLYKKYSLANQNQIEKLKKILNKVVGVYEGEI
ncbi:MAG TPA: carbamoyltransferase C-terminal domain-containing protein [Sedimentibacter sp.]|nr:carbamoyltransferase C-terminal domain-containing protein [Sedimentibacter sp.]